MLICWILLIILRDFTLDTLCKNPFKLQPRMLVKANVTLKKKKKKLQKKTIVVFHTPSLPLQVAFGFFPQPKPLPLPYPPPKLPCPPLPRICGNTPLGRRGKGWQLSPAQREG